MKSSKGMRIRGAAWLALGKRWLLAGVVLGIGFLVKLNALYALLAIGLHWSPRWSERGATASGSRQR